MNNGTRIRYWLVESQEIKDRLREMKEHDVAMREKAAEWAKAQGGNGDVYVWPEGAIAGIDFDGDAPNNWKRVRKNHSAHSPKRSTKGGKQLFQEMQQFKKKFTPRNIGDKFLGAEMLLIGFRMCSPGCEQIGDDLVIMAKDHDTPDEHERWKPVEGLRELKASEYWAMKEEQSA